MNRLHAILKAAALATVPIVGGFVCWFLIGVHAATKAVSGGVNTVLAQTTATLNQTTRTVQAVGKVAMKINDVTVDQQRFWDADEPKLLASINSNLVQLSSTLGTVQGVAGNAGDLLKATTTNEAALTHSTTTAIDTLNDRVAALAPIESSTAQSVQDFDALVKNPQIPLILTNAQSITKEAAGIVEDGHIEADRFIAPTPWYKRDFNYATEAIRIALCAFAKVNCTV
jgi:hypothetical protein